MFFAFCAYFTIRSFLWTFIGVFIHFRPFSLSVFMHFALSSYADALCFLLRPDSQIK